MGVGTGGVAVGCGLAKEARAASWAGSKLNPAEGNVGVDADAGTGVV